MSKRIEKLMKQAAQMEKREREAMQAQMNRVSPTFDPYKRFRAVYGDSSYLENAIKRTNSI